MDLRELIGTLDIRHAGGPAPLGVRVCDITEDSRTALPGSLFVARAGGSADGRAYIAAAAQAGATCVLTDQPGALAAAALPASLRSGLCVLTASDPARAGAALAEAFYGHPSQVLDLIAITGTNGKTTVATLVHAILNAAGVRCGLIGTVTVDDGRELAPASMTTPPAIELSRLLATMREHGCTACAMEASSHALHQGRLAAVRLAVGVFTNLTQDHLDYHHTMDAYAASKRILFESLPADAPAVYNAAVPRGAWMAAPATRHAPCFLGPDTQAQTHPAPASSPASAWRIDAHTITLDGMRVAVTAPDFTLDAAVPLVGEHNAMNLVEALAAADAVLARRGWSALRRREALLAALPACTPPRGRLERAILPDQPTNPASKPHALPAVFIDYAHTDDALTRTLAQLRRLMPPASSLWVVFGCGGDRDRGKRPKMGAAAAAGADRVIVTSDNPRREHPSAIIAEILSGMTPADRARAIVHADRAQAIHAAVLGADSGDVVVIAGKGHETEQILPDGIGGTRSIPFDDRAVATEALRGRAISAARPTNAAALAPGGTA